MFKRRRGFKRLNYIAKRAVRRMSEIKWANTSTVSTQPGGISTLSNISPTVSQDTTKFGRIGQKIRLRFHHFTGYFVNNNLGVGAGQFMRVRVILLQPRMAGLINTDVLNGTDPWGYVQHYNFRVLKDWKFLLGTTLLAANSQIPSAKKLKRNAWHIRNVTFRTTASNTFDDPKDQFMLFVQNDGVVAGNELFFNVQQRISYTDI